MMTRRIHALLVLAAALVCAASCKAAHSDGDAAADAAPAPPPRRGAGDGEEPAAEIEASPPEEDEDPFAVGKWKPLPGIPSYCDVRLAENPAVLASKWEPCSSGRAGCRKLDTSWTKHPGTRLDSGAQLEQARLVAGTPYVLWRRRWPAPFGAAYGLSGYIEVVEPLAGPPVFAMGQRGRRRADGSATYCAMGATFGDHGVGFSAQPRDPAAPVPSSGVSRMHVFGWAPWSALSAWTTRTFDSSELGVAEDTYFVESSMGARGFWFGTRKPKTATHFDVLTETATLADAPLVSEHPIPIPGGALVFDARPPFAIATVKEDGSVERLVTPTAPQFVTWKALDRSAGLALVWVESDYGNIGYANATLWTAPLAATEEALQRRMVAKLPDTKQRGGGWGVANRGVFLSLTGQSTALLTRLSDGMGWEIRAEPGEGFTQAIWVDDDDVLIETAEINVQYDRLKYPSSVLRLSRASLGAPTVPSGL
jgi:hypothetical protein